MVQEYFLQALEELGLDNVWFQRDEATANTARDSMACLRVIPIKVDLLKRKH